MFQKSELNNAVKKYDIQLIQKNLHADPNHEDEKGFNCLHIACLDNFKVISLINLLNFA